MAGTLLVASAALALAFRNVAAAPAATFSSAATTTAVSSSVVSNVFASKQIYANPYYASEIHTSAVPSLPASLAPKASEVANVGTFYWL